MQVAAATTLRRKAGCRKGVRAEYESTYPYVLLTEMSTSLLSVNEMLINLLSVTGNYYVD